MPAGIQVFNPNGSLKFEFSDRLYRVLTVLSAGTSNGAYYNGYITNADTIVGVSKSDSNMRQPSVNVANGAVSWDWGSVPANKRDPNLKIEIVLY